MKKNNFMFLRRLHGRIHEEILRQKLKKAYTELYIRPFLEKKKKDIKCVFLVLTPEHTNLGDHAIAKAIVVLLQEIGIDYVEITGAQLAELQNARLLNLLNNFPIIINGGGNLGTLWFDVEKLMRDVIASNPRSPIFIFPNTFYYEDSDWGKRELEKSIQLYNAHKNLHIYAREKHSFEKMRWIYRDVKLVPDMVLSHYECNQDEMRDGCLLCLRSDREKTITTSEETSLLDQITAIFGENIRRTDMHYPDLVLPEDRNHALEMKYQEFRDAELVITDRLHGMIFSAITGTPCIVLNSKSPKVSGCYEWIKDLEYIKFCEDVQSITALYRSIPIRKHEYSNSNFRSYYVQLSEDVQMYVK